MMKRFFLLSLVLLILMSTVGCGAKADADAALAAAPALIEASAGLNEILYGAGIPASDVVCVGKYNYADANYLSKAGFTTIGGLTRKIREVYSEGYADLLARTVLGGSGGAFARYISTDAMDVAEGDVKILVFTDYAPLLHGTRTYDYSTLRVSDVTKDSVTVCLSVTQSDGGEDSTDEIDVRLVLEETGWRIDSPTY